MLPLNLPKFSVKVTEKAGKPSIWDPVRRKFVALTPEEWVRQHFVNYLVTEKNYPTLRSFPHTRHTFQPKIHSHLRSYSYRCP
jgi:hypothetical protein